MPHHLWLCLTCLAIAAYFVYVEHKERYVYADIIKGVASCCFVVLGYLGAKGYGWPQGTGIEGQAKVILVGLCIGAVADVVLNLRYVFEGRQAQISFLVGILVFLAGHVAYIVALSGYFASILPAFLIGAVVAWLLLRWVFSQIDAPKAFKIFGVFYIGVISIMNVMAIMALFAMPSARTLVFMVGALFFLASDLILIINNFGPEQRFSLRIANLMLYYVAQLLIAISIQLV